jgi:hypothetical protein
MAKLQNIIFRIFALFGSSALAAVAGGALIGVELWKSAALAGIMACAQVVEKLLRFSVDGSLTKEEIEIAFTGAVKAKPEVAETKKSGGSKKRPSKKSSRDGTRRNGIGGLAAVSTYVSVIAEAAR